MIADELWRAKARRSVRVHQSRPRRECVGGLVRRTLIVFVDDATLADGWFRRCDPCGRPSRAPARRHSREPWNRRTPRVNGAVAHVDPWADNAPLCTGGKERAWIKARKRSPFSAAPATWGPGSMCLGNAGNQPTFGRSARTPTTTGNNPDGTAGNRVLRTGPAGSRCHANGGDQAVSVCQKRLHQAEPWSMFGAAVFATGPSHLLPESHVPRQL